MDSRPIPAFYCCYLLRSIRSHASLYVGSTPHPPRRLAQHNGDKKGGAVRTSKKNLQPWEMACIVTGFPSNIAALQFEWAWHNAHITKKISDEQRITEKPKRKAGSKRNPRPRASLRDKLLNLHLFLRLPSFSRWPLQVRFFCEDVYQQWQKECKTAPTELDSKISITLENIPASQLHVEEVIKGDPKEVKLQKQANLNKARISTLNIGYDELKPHIEKSQHIVASNIGSCVVCLQHFESETSTMLVCPETDCSATCHTACLARRFLEEEGGGAVLPTYGTCPSCNTEVRWIDLMKEFSLRTRGAKEINRLFKKPRQRKTKAKAGLSSEIVVEETDDDLDTVVDQDALPAANVDDEPLPDSFLQFEDDEDAMSVASAQSDLLSDVDVLSPQRPSQAASQLNAVIEESDWDGAEVLD